jgi:hypothetical protein
MSEIFSVASEELAARLANDELDQHLAKETAELD